MRTSTSGFGNEFMPAKLSVNLNAIAMLRNRRDLPWPSVADLGRIALKAGEVILVEDTTGRGHLSQSIGGQMRQSIFIPIE